MSTQNITPPLSHTPSDSVNGRNPVAPAIPMNGSLHEHKRTPSMTVTPAGTTSFNTNGSQNKANVQFGSLNNGNVGASSPAMSTPQPSHTQSSSLGVNNLAPRMPSPSNSPSPIPQPVQVSGGRPPSELSGPGKAMNFGQFGNDGPDVNGLGRGVANLSMSDHNRRGSQQSIHSNMGGHDLAPTGPGRGGYNNNRGRGGYGQYGNHHGQYNPNNPSFRPSNGRGGYSNRGNHNMPYTGSPSMQPRQPMMSPGTPQMSAMQMNPGMQMPHYPYSSYPVNTPDSRRISDAVRGKPSRGSLRAKVKRVNGKDNKSKKPTGPSMDPASDNFVGQPNDLFPAAYGQVPITADPSIQYNYQNYYPPYQGYPPQSPRPPFNQPGYGGQNMQPTYSNQGPLPQPMSRGSSQMSAAADRPASTINQTPQTPAAALQHPSGRTPSVSGEKSNFIPPKKSGAIAIKNAAGEVIDFSKKTPTPSAASAVTAAAAPSVPTPPSRTGSAASTNHARAESQSVKLEQNSDEKKRAMQEAIAKKIAQDKEEEAEKLRKAKQAEEEKAQMEAEAAAALEREAEEKKAEAERLEREAQEAKEAEEKAKAAADEKAKADEDAKAKSAAAESEPLNEDDEFERMVAEMEREAAEREAEEARLEEEYKKKKAAEKDAQRKKEEEEAASYEATMKEMERKAEEEELAREKKRAEGGSSDDEGKRMFNALKTGDAGESTEGSPGPATPAESGAATPLSEISMGPPAKGSGSVRRSKPSDLTLNTKASTEPPEPSATLMSLTSARKLEDPAKVSYPSGIVSPTPAGDRKFKYTQEFLLQFQNVFKEKPTLDWDQKIREALGQDESGRSQTARTPSGMGARSASNRGMAPNAFSGPMGAFGGGQTRTLPPGTTSEQRFAMTNASRGGATPANPFAMGRPGSMGPPATMMGRTPSNNPLGAFGPGSPRVGGASRGGSRAESKRNKHSAKHEAEANKSMPLTAGMNLGALEVSASGWKPRSIGQATGPGSLGPDGYMEADVVQRKVKAALNKMTPEKFDKISDGILEIAAQSKQETDGRTLRQVIQLVFEKATDEAHWAPMYAKFCLKMLSTMSMDIKDEGIKDKNGTVVAGGNLFRKYLLNRCQEEFEKGWKINLPGRKEGESEEAVMLSDEYYIAAAAKRRGLGLVKFIGELFKLGMLTERIMHECVKKLLDYEGTPDEAEVESLSSLLRTIGKQLDSPESKAAGRMDAYFERINQTMNIPDLPSRLRFMLLDIMDLRKAGWSSKDSDKGPKTIQQIHEEAEAARAKEEMQRLAQAASRGGGRMPMGRGDARSFSHGGPIPPPDNSNRVGVEDLRRLGNRTAQRQATTPSGSFGPSALGARTNSRRGLGPQIGSTGTSRTGTPPAQADGKKAESSTNAFSALAGLEGAEGPTSPPSNPSSPPTQKSQPLDRERSRSPEKKAE